MTETCPVCAKEFRNTQGRGAHMYRAHEFVSPPIIHGTIAAYQKHKCRCDECRIYVREYYRRFSGSMPRAEWLAELARRRLDRPKPPPKPKVATTRVSECLACGRPFSQPVSGKKNRCGGADCREVAQERKRAATPIVARPVGHSHHWRLEEPNGPLTHAVCVRCGAEKDMYNADAEARGVFSLRSTGRRVGAWKERMVR